MTGPRFFGWVIGGSHPVGVAADWLSAIGLPAVAAHEHTLLVRATEALSAISTATTNLMSS